MPNCSATLSLQYAPAKLRRLLARGLALLALAASPARAAVQDAEAALADADTYTVLIRTTVRYPFGEDTQGRSRGAGFVIDRDRGWILTNAHVTSRSVASITVNFRGGEPVTARRVYVDPVLDLAILAIPPASLPPQTREARLDCGELPRAGAPVVAYGHPGGFSFTGTKGIISGVSAKYDGELLQTDAPINPGNSGGPLINLSSGLIAGINTSSIRSMQNTNFALATRFACPVVELLRAGRNPSPPRTDWRFFVENDDSDRIKVALPGRIGEQLGLMAGDVIASVNGSAARPTNETQLMHAMRGRLDELRIEVERDGKRVTLAGRAEPEPNVLDRTGLYVAGMLLSEVDRRLTREVDVAGMWVEFVAKGGAAETAEVMAGTILVSVNATPTPKLKAARMALQAAAESGKPAVLVFKRAAYSAYSSGLFHWMERQVPIGAIKSVRVGEAD